MSDIHNFKEGVKFEFNPNGDDEHIQLARTILGDPLVNQLLKPKVNNPCALLDMVVKEVDVKNKKITIGWPDDPS